MIYLRFGPAVECNLKDRIYKFKGYPKIVHENVDYSIDITSTKHPNEIVAELDGELFVFTLLQDVERKLVNKYIKDLQTTIYEKTIKIEELKREINNADPQFGRPYRIDIVYFECGSRKVMAIQGLTELYEILSFKEEWEDTRNIDHIRVNEDKFTMSELDLLKLRLKYPYVKALSD